jgi:hypothetical protein
MIRLTDEFANRFLARVDQTNGPVNDYVLGARVTGEQSTETRVSFDFVPSEITAKFDVVLQGVTNSRTTNVTRQAMIDSTARQQFDVRKRVEFDGMQFVTRSPEAVIDGCHQNHQARTPASRVPVIGSIASTVALMAANRYQPVARAEGARRLTERLAPELNNRVDERLSTMNEALAGARQPSSRLASLLDGGFRCRTSDHDLNAEIQFGSETPAFPAPPVSSTAGASVRVHSSAVTAWLTAVAGGGREVPAAEIDRWLAEQRDRLELAREPNGDDDRPLFNPADGVTLVLDEHVPVSVRFVDQQFQIILRVTLRPAVGPELPDRRIVIAYDVRHEADHVLLTPRPPGISSDSPVMGSATLDSAAHEIVRQQIESRLEPVIIPATLIVPISQTGTPLTLQGLTLSDGWLAIDWK